MARYTLHGIFASGPTYKVGLMLNLTSTPFNYEHVDMRSGAHKTPVFFEKNRYGQVPALEDHQAGVTLCQSSAILEYLAEETGQFGPQDKISRQRVREWQYWGTGQIAIGIYRTRGVKLGFVKFPEQVVEANLSYAMNALKEFEGLLEGKGWLVGTAPTIADVDIYGVLAYAGQAGISLEAYPNIRGWMQKVEALPGFKGPEVCLPQASLQAAS